MADVFSRLKRSYIMSNIRSHGNKRTELALLSIFRRYHIIGWRRHQHILGRPDFVFRKQRLAVFVDGCFWHNCPSHAKLPVTNRMFWQHKLKTNRKRDLFVNRTLQLAGWSVLRIWQHDLKEKTEKRLVTRIRRALNREIRKKCDSPKERQTQYKSNDGDF